MPARGGRHPTPKGCSCGSGAGCDTTEGVEGQGTPRCPRRSVNPLAESTLTAPAPTSCGPMGRPSLSARRDGRQTPAPASSCPARVGSPCSRGFSGSPQHPGHSHEAAVGSLASSGWDRGGKLSWAGKWGFSRVISQVLSRATSEVDAAVRHPTSGLRFLEARPPPPQHQPFLPAGPGAEPRLKKVGKRDGQKEWGIPAPPKSPLSEDQVSHEQQSRVEEPWVLSAAGHCHCAACGMPHGHAGPSSYSPGMKARAQRPGAKRPTAGSPPQTVHKRREWLRWEVAAARAMHPHRLSSRHFACVTCLACSFRNTSSCSTCRHKKQK